MRRVGRTKEWGVGTELAPIATSFAFVLGSYTQSFEIGSAGLSINMAKIMVYGRVLSDIKIKQNAEYLKSDVDELALWKVMS